MTGTYVVSEDIHLLLKQWAKQRGFVLPSDAFFGELRQTFVQYMRTMFTDFDLVSEHELEVGIAARLNAINLPVVSLDRVYIESKYNFDIARLTHADGTKGGLGHRAQCPTLLTQTRTLISAKVKEVVLVDDVLFSGDLLMRIIELFATVGITVKHVVAGVGIKEGIDRIEQAGCRVHCVRTYSNVIDEVCERDFYPGVPYSGRLLSTGENIGVPYLLPFGDPENWASIPKEQTTVFSQFCLRQTVTLFTEIEKFSNKMVRCSDLGRNVYLLPRDDTRFVDALLCHAL